MRQNGTRARVGKRKWKRKPKQMSDGATSKSKTLPDLGITRDQSSNWQQLADIPEQEFEDASLSQHWASSVGSGAVLGGFASMSAFVPILSALPPGTDIPSGVAE